MAQVAHENLKEQVNHLEQEARMVLPGVEALFGFQFIAVFNQTFKTLLSPYDQRLHLFSLVLTAVSAAFLMAPAAYHRQVEPDRVSVRFVHFANRFVTLSMAALSLALSIDIFIVGNIICEDRHLSAGLATLVFLFFLCFGF